MRKTLAITLLTLFMIASFYTVSFAKSYVCYRYVDGEPTGSFVNITANSKTDAEKKAIKKLKDLGGKVTGVNCEIKI